MTKMSFSKETIFVLTFKPSQTDFHWHLIFFWQCFQLIKWILLFMYNLQILHQGGILVFQTFFVQTFLVFLMTRLHYGICVNCPGVSFVFLLMYLFWISYSCICFVGYRRGWTFVQTHCSSIYQRPSVLIQWKNQSRWWEGHGPFWGRYTEHQINDLHVTHRALDKLFICATRSIR